MQKFELTSTMVKTLKGAPLSVLMLLLLARQPVSAQYLERESGYSDKAVNSALLYLADHGLITRNGRYAWQIAAGVKVLPLMNLIDEPEEGPETVDVCAQTSEPEPEEIEDYSDDLPEAVENTDKSDSFCGTRRNSESEKFRLPVSSSGSSLNLVNPELELKPPLPVLDARDSEKFRVDENLAACDSAGIHEPKRSAISRMERVTSKLIRYHTQTAPNIPLAIYRIEKGWKIRAGWMDSYGAPAEIIDVATEVQEPELPAETVNAWEEALVILEKQFRKVEFNTWIRPLLLMDYDGGMYRLQIGNRCGAEWLEKHALQAIEAALRSSVQIIVGG